MLPETTKTILILKMGSTYPDLAAKRGDFDRWVLDRLPLSTRAHARSCSPDREALPDPAGLSAIIITGSHSMVTNPSPSELYALRWLELALALEVPTLGICYGHQMLGVLLGGEVLPLPDGPEFGVVPIRLTDEAAGDPVFQGMHSPLWVAAAHFQGVARLPSGAVVLGTGTREPHHAVRYLPWVWGVQFHPEFDRTALEAYVERHREYLVDQRADPEGVLSRVRLWQEPTDLLACFAKTCISFAD